MSLRTGLLVALALLAGSPALLAQSAPAPAAPDSAGCCQARRAAKPDCMSGMMQGMRHMPGGMMEGGMTQEHRMPMPTAAEEARLDSLVSVMHQSKGDKKLAAMEKVLDQLLAHRAAMRDHMRQMMEGMGGMMGGSPDHAPHN